MKKSLKSEPRFAFSHLPSLRSVRSLRLRFGCDSAALCSSRLCSLIFLLFYSYNLLGQTNPASRDDLPPLRPPRAEMLPSFWELHQVAFVAVAVSLLLLVSAAVWVYTRPKPPILTPPSTKARAALNNLRNQPETGELLSKISQVTRSYFLAAFNLPQRELTTAEFSRIIVEHETVDRSLAEAVVEFLGQCDHRKFAPPSELPPLRALDCALKLIDEAEIRRGAVLAKARPQ
jgi:hypothetical protein